MYCLCMEKEPPQGIEQKKKEVILRPVKENPLTAYNEEFLIDQVNEGEDVLVGWGGGEGKFYLRCDFSSFAEILKVVTPENLDKFFNEAGKLIDKLPDLDEETRKLLHTCWRATRITKKMLGPVASEFVRNNSFGKFKQGEERICVKPLSQCRGEAVCSEYALTAQHILQKLGIKSSVVIGAFSNNPENALADRHTFLVLDDGKVVFDPTHSASAGDSDSWPPQVFVPEKPLTLENLQNMSTDEKEEFGHKMKCTNLITKEVKMYGSGAS